MDMKLILLGAPGAGKGTQADILSRKLNLPVISTGHILRAAVKEGTPVGLLAKSYMDAGKLVPDEVVIGIVVQRLAQPDCQSGFILDGVPRTIAQAEALEKAGVHFDNVLSLEISDEEIEQRMEGRRFCHSCGTSYHVDNAPSRVPGVCDKCGGQLELRDDDKPETVKHRLEVYHQETEPLKEFYAQRGVLRPVRNQPSIEATTQVVLAALNL